MYRLQLLVPLLPQGSGNIEVPGMQGARQGRISRPAWPFPRKKRAARSLFLSSWRRSLRSTILCRTSVQQLPVRLCCAWAALPALQNSPASTCPTPCTAVVLCVGDGICHRCQGLAELLVRTGCGLHRGLSMTPCLLQVGFCHPGAATWQYHGPGCCQGSLQLLRHLSVAREHALFHFDTGD